MVNIIDKIKSSIETIAAVPFIYGGAEELNVIIERCSLPCVIAYLVENSQIIEEAGMMKERLTLAMFFVNKTDYDSDSVENEAIITAQREKCFRWLMSMRGANGYDIEVSTPTNGQRIYDTFDDIVTGYGVTVNVQEIEGITRCPII